MRDELLDEAFVELGIAGTTDYAKVQKMLALALSEAVRSYKPSYGPNDFIRAVCYFGATPDGIKEYDESLMWEHLFEGVVARAAPQDREAWLAQLKAKFGYAPGKYRQYVPEIVYETVLRDVLKYPVKTVLIDAACASSLYATDLGIKSLLAKECDVAICGGGFAAGMGNNCLFAQFSGLARQVVTPLDGRAEGTVFSDGAVVLLLKRLRDAMPAGDHIYGVIRGMGVSSDGKAPAVNVPSVAGQQLAIERAYKNGAIEKSTIQYVEAHATATSGDVVEFTSLQNVFSGEARPQGKLAIGSGKALIGHTGWASGAASIIKILNGFRDRTIPAQYSFRQANERFRLAESAFDIPTSNTVWKGNIDGLPRRAAVNGFGFGGTNAHVILEEFDRVYHAQLCSGEPPKLRQSKRMVLFGMTSLFPGWDGIADNIGDKRRFDRSDFKLPTKKLVLPDVKEHMSYTQYLSLMASDSLLQLLISHGVDLSRIGIVLSFNDKCEKACIANQFIYEDRVKRLLRSMAGSSDKTPVDVAIEAHFERLHREHLTTGPYTLPGIMPNVITGRVANMYDIKGPNFTLGEGASHSLMSLKIAQEYLNGSDVDAMLCGGMNLDNSVFAHDCGVAQSSGQDGIVAFGVTTEAFALAMGLPIMAVLTVTGMQAYRQAA